MSLLSSLLPGIREIRAPLVSGYLWLLFGWLLVQPVAPDKQKDGPYNDLAHIFDSLGRPGQALAISVLAFLLGSLITSAMMYLVNYRNRRKRHEIDYGGADPEAPHRTSSLDEVLRLAGLGAGRGRLPGWRGYMAGSEPDPNVDRAILAISDRELGEEQRRLESAVEDASRRANGKAAVSYLRRGTTELVSLDVPEDGAYVKREFVIPTFWPGRDLFSEIAVLRTRLMEMNESTGLKIERIHYEAEFRFAVAVALGALVVLFAGDNLWWCFAIVGPLALIAQGYFLEREGERQLIDALRARSGTAELEQVTPVFARYRHDASVLREALAVARWHKHDQDSHGRSSSESPMSTKDQGQ